MIQYWAIKVKLNKPLKINRGSTNNTIFSVLEWKSSIFISPIAVDPLDDQAYKERSVVDTSNYKKND